MRVSINLNKNNNKKLVFSDSSFSFARKKPTISVIENNCETKIASFNSRETFEWFITEVLEIDLE